MSDLMRAQERDFFDDPDSDGWDDHDEPSWDSNEVGEVSCLAGGFKY